MTYRQDNTEGYTDVELAALNAELAERQAGMEPGSDEWHEAEKRHSDEVARRSAAAILGRRGGSAGTPAQLAQRRAAAVRGGRPVVLGTIEAESGRATVRYAPGLGRVEVVLPDGAVEIPEEASVASLDEAGATAAAWYGRSPVWGWQPR